MTTIAAVRLIPLHVPLERAFWMSLEPYRTASEIIVEIETEDGVVGHGEVHGRPHEQIIQILEGVFAPALIGMDAIGHELVWDRLFQLSFSRAGSILDHGDGQPHFGSAGKPQMMAALAGVDIALWDIKGKVLGLPLWRLLGAGQRTVAVYASGGYYGPDGEAAIDQLVDEVHSYVAAGYDTVKIKVGGLSHAEDARRVAALREAFPDLRIMLDANAAYTVGSAVAAAHTFAPYDIVWFEDPVAWFASPRDLAAVAARSPIAIASGEQELHGVGCRDLVEAGAVRYLQFDATRAGGITAWLRAAAHAGAHDVAMAPHHDPQIHGHLLAAVPNGHIQEVFPNAARDPLWSHMFTERPTVVDGKLVLTDSPGLGIAFDPGFVERYALPGRIEVMS